jgi:hypothetical protein
MTSAIWTTFGNGYSSTVFAYGQTGSGKLNTIVGPGHQGDALKFKCDSLEGSVHLLVRSHTGFANRLQAAGAS